MCQWIERRKISASLAYLDTASVADYAVLDVALVAGDGGRWRKRNG